MATANTKLKIDYGFDSYGTSNVNGDMLITGSLNVQGNVAFTGVTVGDSLPDQDQRSLGNTTFRWNLNGYTANIGNPLTVSGNTTLGDVLTVSKTISGGNTTITGFANVSTSVNSALLSVGTSFIANTTGAYHTGAINAASITTTGVVANVTGVYPFSNTTGTSLGTSANRWIVNANTGNFSGDVTITGNTSVNNATLNGTLQTIAGNANFDSGVLFVDSVNNRVGVNNTTPSVAFEVTGSANVSTSVNSALFTVGTSFIANSSAIVGTGFANVATSVNSALFTVGTSFIANTTGVYHTGVVNAASLTVGSSLITNSTGVYHTGLVNAASINIGSSSFIANSTAVVIADPLTANGSTGTAGQLLASNGSTGSPYWVSGGISSSDDTSTNATYYPTFSTASSGSLTSLKVSSTKLTYNPSTGTLSSTVVTASSDERLKRDVTTFTHALDTVNSLRGVSFIRNDSNRVDYGVIAQEIERVLPAVVHNTEDGYKSVSYNSIIGVLIEAIKELKQEIDQLKK